jgi:hypothetical protein
MTLPPLQRYDCTETIDKDVWGMMVLRKRQYGAWCLYKNQVARESHIAQRLKEILNTTIVGMKPRRLIEKLIAELEQKQVKNDA